jgi:hypothetical protein
MLSGESVSASQAAINAELRGQTREFGPPPVGEANMPRCARPWPVSQNQRCWPGTYATGNDRVHLLMWCSRGAGGHHQASHDITLLLKSIDCGRDATFRAYCQIDSEPLPAFPVPGRRQGTWKILILGTSGGAQFNCSREQLAQPRPGPQAPNWDMGAKITIQLFLAQTRASSYRGPSGYIRPANDQIGHGASPEHRAFPGCSSKTAVKAQLGL